MHIPNSVPVRTRQAVLIVAFVLVAPVFPASGNSPCGDFLARLHKKPDNLEFQGCQQQTKLQNTPFEATYRVPGIHAAEVESYLAREFKIKKLSRNCCVWESTENFYRDKRSRAFVISMATEETTISSRDQWPKIDYFYVVVDWYRDEP